MLREWHRMLKPGGMLTIEAADFNRCVLWLFHPSRCKRELRISILRQPVGPYRLRDPPLRLERQGTAPGSSETSASARCRSRTRH